MMCLCSMYIYERTEAYVYWLEILPSHKVKF